MQNNRGLLHGWNLLVVVMTGWLLLRLLGSGVPVQTNMLELLPKADRDVLVLQAVQQHSKVFVDQVVFLVGAVDAATSHAQAVEIAAQLQRAPLFREVFVRADSKTGMELYQFYRPYRAGLLTEEDRSSLATGDYVSLRQRIFDNMASPAGALTTAILTEDPAMLFGHFVMNIMPYTGAFSLQEGFLTAERDARVYTLLRASLRGDPFSMDVQKKFAVLHAEVVRDLHVRTPQVVMLAAGMVRNAGAGTQQAAYEISLIGGGSLLGVVLLFLLGFASLRPLLYALVPIVVGIIFALVVCILAYGSIHVMTLVFGTSLIGVSIDYGVHYFADQADVGHTDTSAQSIQRIFPAITLGLITSLLGYAAFFVAPFPGLQQIALFSFVGLLVAYLCVVIWFPLLSVYKSKSTASVTLRMAAALLRFWRWHQRLRVPVLPLLIVVLTLIGLMQVYVDDDIRLLDNSPAELRQEQQALEQVAGFRSSSQFFLVRGKDPEEVLQREELLVTALREQVAAAKLAGFQAVSSGLPSQAAQQRSYQWVRAALQHPAGLQSVLQEISFTPEVIQRYQQQYVAAEPTLLDFSAWQRSSQYRPGQWLSGEQGEQASLVYLYGVHDAVALQQLAAGLQGVQWVDQVADITELFGNYRRLGNYLVLATLGLIFLLLIWRYRFVHALRILFPPLLAAAAAIAVMSIGGQPLTLFNTLALLLVISIGIDYALFFAESQQQHLATMQSVLLAAVTTILSFGLLVLSSTPAIRSIGGTVLCGIGIAFLLSPLAAPRAVVESQ